MKVAIETKKTTKQEQETRVSFLPHAYNYMIKEEILDRFHSVDSQRVESIKGLLKNNGHSIINEASKVAERIIEGV